MRLIRFHLDESVNLAVADGLRRRGIDVTTTSEAKLLGVPDPEQLAFAVSQQRVIFTHDADFLRLHGAGVQHWGIVYSRQGARSLGEIIRNLMLLWEYYKPEELRNQVEYL